MFSYFPRRDDVASFRAPRVGDQIKDLAGLAERLYPLLAVGHAVIDGLYDLRIVENADRPPQNRLCGIASFPHASFRPS